MSRISEMASEVRGIVERLAAHGHEVHVTHIYRAAEGKVDHGIEIQASPETQLMALGLLAEFYEEAERDKTFAEAVEA